jgi:hypothetical protein
MRYESLHLASSGAQAIAEKESRLGGGEGERNGKKKAKAEV